MINADGKAREIELTEDLIRDGNEAKGFTMAVEMKLEGDGPHKFAVKIGEEFNIRIENVVPGTHSERTIAGLLDSSGWSGDGVGNTFRLFHFKAIGVGSTEVRFPPMKHILMVDIVGSGLVA